MVHFDLDDRYQDENVVGSAITRRDGVMLSVAFHVLLVAALIYLPRLPMFQVSPEELERRQAQLAEQLQQPQEQPRFVFVQPKIDLKAIVPPEKAPLSDQDRKAQTPEIARIPENPLPLSKGNSSERVEEELPERARGEPQPQPETQIARVVPPTDNGLRSPLPTPPKPAGNLGDALRNLQKYVENQRFDNPQGGKDNPGATIQFDTKGVEFGPWLRRFVAQVRRNWYVPSAAEVLRGHVVLQFNIHRTGAITDLKIVQPSAIEGFTNAAYNAILGSNPTEPLPPEYPSEEALFTVTFYYNEEPPN